MSLQAANSHIYAGAASTPHCQTIHSLPYMNKQLTTRATVYDFLRDHRGWFC